MKLKELLREDLSGVRFFGMTECLRDMSELTVEDVRLLVRTIRASGLCDLLVIDADCRMDAVSGALQEAADRIFLISDGGTAANRKVLRYAAHLNMECAEILNKTALIYNRFGSRNGEKLQTTIISEAGGFPRIEGADPRSITEQFSRRDTWDSILQV